MSSVIETAYFLLIRINGKNRRRMKGKLGVLIKIKNTNTKKEQKLLGQISMKHTLINYL